MDGAPRWRDQVAARGAGGRVEVVAGSLAARGEHERTPRRSAGQRHSAPADPIGAAGDRLKRTCRADRGPLAVLPWPVVERAAAVGALEAYPRADLAHVGRPRARGLGYRDADHDALRAVHRHRADRRARRHVAKVDAGRRRVDASDVRVRPVGDADLGRRRTRGDDHRVLEDHAVGLVASGHRRREVLPAVGAEATHRHAARAERLRGGARKATRPRRPRVVGEVDGDVGVIPAGDLPGLLTPRRRHPHRRPAAEVGSGKGGVVADRRRRANRRVRHDGTPALGGHGDVAPRRRVDAGEVNHGAVDVPVRVAPVVIPGGAAVNRHTGDDLAGAGAGEVHAVDVERPVIHRQERELARGERGAGEGAEDLGARGRPRLHALNRRDRL